MRKHQLRGEKKEIRLLVLDDDVTIGLALQSYFCASGYIVDVETNPYKAIDKIRVNHYDIMLLDFLMTPICGDKVVEEIRKFNDKLFIILLTGHISLAPPIKTIRELNIQGYYQKSDRFDQLELLVESCVKSIDQINTIRSYQMELETANGHLVEANAKLQQSYDKVIKLIRLIVDAKDIYTRGHSDRVALLAEKVSIAMNRSGSDTKRIKTVGLFHDIGKLKIPDAILLKEGALTTAERAKIQQHSLYAVEILANSNMFDEMIPGILQHHERYDGKGYPHGIAGKEICEDARIIAIADTFDAMTSFRRYRVNVSAEQAIAEIINNSGTQFDAEIVNVFGKVIKDFDEFKDNEEWVATYKSQPIAI